MNAEKLKLLAPDLTKSYPRSPRETLAGYVIAARMLDKCRATIADTMGEYHFDCRLDNQFLEFTGITAEQFKSYVATGATDTEIATWVELHSKVKDRAEVVTWNNKLRYTRLCDLPMEVQLKMEDYIPKFIPKNRPVYVWFDIYDLEEERI